MNKNSILHRSGNVTFQSIAGEAILIRMDTGTYYSLNAVGTDFWELLDGRSTIAQHATAIASKYNQKADEFATALISLTQQKGDHKAQQSLADQYDIELEIVQQQIAQLANDFDEAKISQYPQTIAKQFYVTPEMVQDDLIEIAHQLFTDKLITAR